MKKSILNLFIVSCIVAINFGCKKKGCTDPEAVNYSSEAKKDDNSCKYEELNNTNSIIEGNISTNTTLKSSIIYELKGKVVVKSDYTLTIEPGTIIKAQEGIDVNASALIIERGAKINANGLSSKPIIFTTVLDNIKIGEFAGTNLSENVSGKWGGVIILGNAPVSTADGNTLGQIEGIPATEDYGTYGGNNSSDNSGVLNYVSIRYGGAVIGSGNEINGLTLGGVGSSTTISNIEILSNLDDGIEIFGGTVNLSNILVSFVHDDGIDIDQNWAGTLDNFYIINNSGIDSDEALEIDGPEGTTNTGGLFTLKNGTCILFGGGNANGDFKAKAQGNVNNVVFGKAKIRASFDEANACASKSDAYTNLTNATPKLIFTETNFSSVLVYTDAATCNLPADYQANAEAKMNANSSVVGGNKTVFNTWTWTSVKGKL